MRRLGRKRGEKSKVKKSNDISGTKNLPTGYGSLLSEDSLQADINWTADAPIRLLLRQKRRRLGNFFKEVFQNSEKNLLPLKYIFDHSLHMMRPALLNVVINVF